jgi:hypothetical protein
MRKTEFCTPAASVPQFQGHKNIPFPQDLRTHRYPLWEENPIQTHKQINAYSTASLNKSFKIPVMLRPLLSPVPLALLVAKRQAGQFPLLGLHLQDLVFDRVLDDQTDNLAGACLAQTMDAVDGLVFDGGSPP